jgi:hypothetical protein
MRETDWIVGMPTLAMTGFEHHFDNPAAPGKISLLVLCAQKREKKRKEKFA